MLFVSNRPTYFQYNLVEVGNIFFNNLGGGDFALKEQK